MTARKDQLAGGVSAPGQPVEGAAESPRGDKATRRHYTVARLTPAAIKARRRVLGGTDAAAVLGLSSRHSPWDVYAEKVLGVEREQDPGNQPMAWGQRLEPLIRWHFEDRSGRRLVKPRGLLRHPTYPFIAGHLDGLDDEIVWEGKTSRTAEGWGRDGSEDVPTEYRVQVLHYCAITGRSKAVISVLIGGSDYREFTIPAPPDVLELLVASEVAWWEDHVVKGLRPEYDGSEAAGAYLDRTEPDGSQLVALPEQYPTIGRLVAAERAYAAAKVDRERMRQVVRDAMGAASTLLAPGVKVSASIADRKSVDWGALVAEWSRRLEAAGIDLKIGMADFTTTTRVQSLRVTLGPDADALQAMTDAAMLPALEGEPNA